MDFLALCRQRAQKEADDDTALRLQEEDEDAQQTPGTSESGRKSQLGELVAVGGETG